MKKVLLLFSLFIAGCANADFPFCCDQQGDKSVPYSTTYLFNQKVGFTDIGGSQSFLDIVSLADLDNLFNAANVSKAPGTGSVSGVLLSLVGGGVDNIILEATDADGNKIGDLFYNSLGGIPDFSTTSGSNASGGFTLLNAPPGEVYLKAVQGGRGKDSVFSWADAVSILEVGVVSVTPPFVGVTGSVQEYNTTTAIQNAALTPLGIKGLSVSSASGKYRFPSLGSDSRFIIKATAPGYFPTYQELATDLSALQAGVPDVTLSLELLSESAFQDYLTRTRLNGLLDGTKGVLVGRAIDPDGTLRNFTRVVLTDDQGALLNFDPVTGRSRVYLGGGYRDPVTGSLLPTYFWFDPAGTKISYFDSNMNAQTYDCAQTPFLSCPPVKTVGITDGSFFALNLPPGTVHLSATAHAEGQEGFLSFTGGGTVEIFPGSASIHDVPMNQTTLGKSSFFQNFLGNVTESDGKSPVSFAAIFALGNAASLTAADIYGNFNVPLNANLFLDQTSSIFKVSLPFYIDTYQKIQIDGAVKNLSVYSTTTLSRHLSAAGLASQYDPSRGILTGMIVDNNTGRGTDGVSLETTDIGGNAVGDVRYFDSSGLPTLNKASFKNGRYMVFNLPPGLIQVRVVSEDDSGNLWVPAYPGGIFLSDIHVNNGPPPAVQVSGSTSNLDGTAISNAALSVTGEKVRFASRGDGTFSQPFSSYSHYLVKARAPQASALDTYTLFEAFTSDISQMTLWALTSSAVQSQVKNETFTVDFSRGILGGKVTTLGFAPLVPLSQFQSSPVADISPQRMVAGLFDEDSEVDIAMLNSSGNTLTILLGGGDGTFRESSGSPYCLPLGTSLQPGQTCLTGANPVSVRSVDINGDGVSDLIVANKGTDSITVLLGTRKGNFIPAGAPVALPAGSAPIAVSVGDFNNDQKIDMVVLGSGNNTFYTILGNGNGTFSASSYPFYSGGSAPVAMLSRDFNGDGNLDLAILNQGSNAVNIFLGTGNGGVVPAPNSPIPVGTGAVSIASEDLNGDGTADLVITNQLSGTLTVLLGNGRGIFKEAKGSPITLSSPPEIVTLNDVNGDGRPDILVTTTAGKLLDLTGLGDGTFSPETAYPAGGNPSNLLVADFNDDGFSDLLVFQKNSGGSGRLAFLAGKEVSLPNVTLEALDLDGRRVGDIRYLDDAGNILSGNQTGFSGRFIVYNVPPGRINLHAIQGASGNRFLTSYPGGATFENIAAIAPWASAIQFGGSTVDLVGGLLARNVDHARISVLGTGVQTLSDGNANFNFQADANNFLFFKLER